MGALTPQGARPQAAVLFFKGVVYMNVIIRRLEHKEHEYLAYTKSLCGRGTYFVYFQDNIWGAVVLHNFIEMLRSFFQPLTVQLRISDQTLTLQNEALVELLKAEAI